MSHLEISLLGTFQITRGAAPVTTFESNKARALLAYLVIESDRPHRRDALAALLWPESAQGAALSSLRNALANLRLAIGDREADPPYLKITRETIQFNRNSDCYLDAALLIDSDSHSQDDIRSRASAVKNYHGPFLEGFSIPDSAAFEEWVGLWRERLEQSALEELRWLADYYETCGEYTQALAYARRRTALDPWMEEGHCRTMRLLVLNGQREQALRQYHTLQETLKHDLGTEPSESATHLYQEILSGSMSAAHSKIHPLHNLPVQVTSFIGREKEIEQLKQIFLSDQTRLVTVTGAGGTGKTRMALHAAEELLDNFPQGTWLVELAAVTDPTLVPEAVASTLGLREDPDRTVLQVLVDFLRAKHVMIILDTCEHLVDAVASLADQILHASPKVVILATSREILGISGEMPLLCPNLALPDLRALPPTIDSEQHSALASCEAVRLFAERAALASPSFEITPTNITTVAQVCCQLDGIPLAIELAAARLRMLSIEQIAERLDHAFVFLTGGSRTALPRQQTLRAAIDWSYNLLTPAERTLLLRLSIFSGGWTLEAAEAICTEDDADGDILLTGEMLNLQSRLADKSLILVEAGKDGKPRYRILDTIRQYAHEHLLETGGEPRVLARHLAYYLQLSEQAEPHLRTRGTVEWLNRLEAELGNLRQALEWSLSGSIEQGLRLGAALLEFWHVRGRRLEGAQRLTRLLEADSAGQPIQQRAPSSQIVRGKALVVAGYLNHYYPGIYADRAWGQLKEGKTIFQELGDPGQKYLPSVMFYTASTEEDVRDCLDAARKEGDEFYAAECTYALIHYLIEQGNLTQATTYAQEHLAIRQKIGDVEGEAFATYLLADQEFMQGNPQRATERWEASKRLYHMVEDVEFSLYCSSLPARIALAQGDYQQALQLSEAQLAAGQGISSSIAVADAIGHLCWAYWALKEYDRVPQKCEEVLGQDWAHNLPCGRGTPFYVFGRVALSRGEYARACAYLQHFDTIAIPERFLGMQALGILAAATGQEKRAAVLFGALDEVYPWLKNVTSPAERGEYEQALRFTRDALGRAAFQSAWAEGKAMTWDQAKAFASQSVDLQCSQLCENFKNNQCRHPAMSIRSHDLRA